MVESLYDRAWNEYGAIRVAFYSLWSDHCCFILVFRGVDRIIRTQARDVIGIAALYPGDHRLCRLWYDASSLSGDAGDLRNPRIWISSFRICFPGLDHLQYAKISIGKSSGMVLVCITGGLNVLGPYYSSLVLDKIGYQNTLWSSIFWVLIGALFALFLNQARFEKRKSEGSRMKELLKGITITRDHPKVLIGGIVRVINTTAQFAFPVFMPIYMADYGFTTVEWLQIWGTIFTANIAFNLIFGFVGDGFGWRNTIMWFGGVGCGITTLLFFYSPVWFDGHYWLVMLSGVLWGALLAGYVPLTALVPSLVKDDKGAAMSILNLGAGLPVFIGPALVGIFIGWIGNEGMAWLLAILYFLSAFLTRFLTLPEEHELAETT